MNKACIIGASGYSGAELARLLWLHPDVTLEKILVSANSEDSGKTLQQLYGQFPSSLSLTLESLEPSQLSDLAQEMDFVFLATPHDVAAKWLPELAGGRAIVLDLSGAHRFVDQNIYARYYGFEHQEPAWLEKAVYGLVDWYEEHVSKARIVAVPGCYATASLLATKPVAELLHPEHHAVISAVSGISGAGRKATLTNSFCELSMQAYGLLSHRHSPEISTYLSHPVVFTPHIAPFKRGILATCTLKLKSGVDTEQIKQAFDLAYANAPLVRVTETSPKLDDVVGSSRCHIHWQYDQENQYLVVVSALDNLLKGAAGQAVQCMNLTLGLASHTGLTQGQIL